jgi:uracil-DNA glycosylase family 4
MAPTCGPVDASIAVVSRSPGRHDIRLRKPFSGPSGKVLDHLLSMNDVRRENVLTTNVVLCYYDGTPPPAAIKACSARLADDLTKADTIIAAGSEAVSELTNRRSLNGARGYAHERVNDLGKRQRIIATNNPAIVLRDDSTFPNLVKDFRLALNPLPPPELPDIDWTNDVNEARRWLQSISKSSYEILSIDIETKGLRANADVVALGLAAAGTRGLSFGERVCNDGYTFRHYIAPLVSGTAKTRYLYHNGKFDVRNFRSHGVRARVDEDTLLLSWLLDERSDEEQVHSLSYLLMNELNWPNYEPKEVSEYKSQVKNLEKQLRFDELRELPVPDELYRYNALDAAGTALLYPILRSRAESEDLLEVYYKYMIPASDALVTVELTGATYDTERALDMLEEEVWPALDKLREQLRWIVGDGDYNPNSSQQNSALVYDKWRVLHNLPLKNERTVDKSVYTELKAGRFVCGEFGQRDPKLKELIMRWADTFADFKALDKQRSTYIEGMVPRALANGGKLHTDFKLHSTTTGRTSSSNPNLQNITRPKEGLPNIRSLFVASDKDHVILSADYSQAELRTIACVSGDNGLLQIYREGLDLHSIAAERFYGSEFTKEQRSRAKNMDFGVAYGQSAQTFQEKHDIPEEEAERFILWWWENFPGVREWTNEIAKKVTTEGIVVSSLGFKRRFHLITKENRKAAIREGINFVPQNVAAWFTIWSLCRIIEELPPAYGAIILTVHDSIVLDVHRDRLADVAALVRLIMGAAAEQMLAWTGIPFEVDLQIGPSWGELVDYNDLG